MEHMSTNTRENNMKITFEATLEDITTIISMIQVSEEIKEEQSIPPITLDGYSVKQYKPSSMSNDKYEQTYKGFKVYRTGVTGVYWRWYQDDNFDNRSDLIDTLETTKAMIDDHVMRMNHV